MFGVRGKLSENLIFASEPTHESLLSSGASDANIYLSRSMTASIIFVLASFVFISILGMGMSMEMTDSQATSCPFMTGYTTICQMSVTEHITRWQQAFVGIPTKTNFLALVVVFAAVSIPFIKPFSQFGKLTELAARLFAYHKAHFVKIFDPLLLAFSDGILNPRIYESAHI